MSGMFGNEGFIDPGSMILMSKNVLLKGLGASRPFLGCLGMEVFSIFDGWN